MTHFFHSIFLIILPLSLCPFHSLPFPPSILPLYLTMTAQNGSSGNDFTVKAGLAQMLKGGVIMDVVNAEQVCSCDFTSIYNAIANLYLDSRPALLRRPVPPLSWPSSVSPPISAPRVASPACRTPA